MAAPKTIVWYEDPFESSLFAIFFILFWYSIYLLVSLSTIIKDGQILPPDAFQQKYDKTLQDVEQLYVVVMIFFLVNFLMVNYFVFRLIPPQYYTKYLDQNIGMIFILYVFISSAWILSVYNGLNNVSGRGFVSTASTLTLVAALGLIGWYGYTLYKQQKLIMR